MNQRNKSVKTGDELDVLKELSQGILSYFGHVQNYL